MGEANNESRRRMSGGGMEHLFGKYPNQRDLLQRFMAASSNNMNHNTHAGQSGYVKQEQQEEEEQEEEEEEEEEGIELNLGLSLGGRFGIDKNAGSRKKLIRSTSVASSIPLIRDEYDAAMNPAVPVASYHPTLIRTSSLPTETEEEWRKRKEMQTLRRMEAKRRRSEKQKNNNSNPRTDKDGVGSGIVAGGAGAGGEEERREIERENSIGFKQYMMAAAAAAATAAASPGSGSNRVGASPPIGLPGWAAAAAARQGLLGGGSDTAAAAGSKGKSSLLGGLQGFGQPNSQGSVESQGGGSSSGMSEPVQGSSSGGEVRSPGSTHSLQELNNQDTIGTSGKNANENTQKTAGTDEAKPSTKRPESTTESRGKETGMSAMEDMPCVFTKGDGPNGQRIDGILYKYGKGEEVRIMCVCHGWFLSPAAFVKHAGGGDVDNPLRHIVVNRSANSFL